MSNFNYNADLSLKESESRNHNYVNLNQTYTGDRVPSYSESRFSNASDGDPTSPRLPQPHYINTPQDGAVKNWFSPASSVKSNSRPPSFVDPRGYGIKDTNRNQRLGSIASSAFINRPPNLQKLNPIDEDPPMQLSVPESLLLCQNPNSIVQMNALAYLQHLTFQNKDAKLEISNNNGLRTIIELTGSPNIDVSINALSVLKNISFIEMDIVATNIELLGGVPQITELVHQSKLQQDNNGTPERTQRELAIDVLWNLSTKHDLKAIIVRDVVATLVQHAIVPECLLQKQQPGNYVALAVDGLRWTGVLRNALGIIRNISYDNMAVRMSLRNMDGLVDCLVLGILARLSPLAAAAIDDTDSEVTSLPQSPVIASDLIDSKIVENCICILRNLTFALQEIVDKDYHTRKHITATTKKSTRGKQEQRPVFSTPKPSGLAKGVELLWNARFIVSLLGPVLKQACNAVTLEAATGIIQNLTAGDWEPSQQVRLQVRQQQLLASLVELVKIGTDELVRSSATALRNLAEEVNSRLLVGREGLGVLAENIPMNQKEMLASELTSNSLSALLSLIYVLLKDNVEFMKSFVSYQGIARCEFVRDTPHFINQSDECPEKVRFFSQSILDLMSRTPAMQRVIKDNSHARNPNSSTAVVISSPKSDDIDYGARSSHALRDSRYSDDRGGAEMITNNLLQQRNSAAFKTTDVPGYGQVRTSVSQRNSEVGGRMSVNYVEPQQVPNNRTGYNYSGNPAVSGYRQTPTSVSQRESVGGGRMSSTSVERPAVAVNRSGYTYTVPSASNVHAYERSNNSSHHALRVTPLPSDHQEYPVTHRSAQRATSPRSTGSRHVASPGGYGQAELYYQNHNGGRVSLDHETLPSYQPRPAPPLPQNNSRDSKSSYGSAITHEYARPSKQKAPTPRPKRDSWV